jgi:hypothetical protein
MKRLLGLVLLLSTLAFGQGTATKVHGAGSLPALCTAATATQSGDTVIVSNTLYLCTATNTWSQETITVAFGTAALGTTLIPSFACASTVTVTATGVTTSDNVSADFNANPTSTTGYTPGNMLTIIKYPTAGNVNFIVCNNTPGGITPSAVTLNWRVLR